jgi:cytochrome c-type biogenesis protein CcmH/NrfG
VLFLEVALVGSLTTQWPMGESFGMRALTCTLSVPALGLAWLAFHVSPRHRVFLGIVAVVCTVYSLVFALQYRMDLLPRQDWLTSEELARDKIFLRQAVQRQAEVRVANALLRDGHSSRALEVLQNAGRRYGDSRFLLEALAEAYTREGKQRQAEETRLRLKTLLDRRLY